MRRGLGFERKNRGGSMNHPGCRWIAFLRAVSPVTASRDDGFLDAPGISLGDPAWLRDPGRSGGLFQGLDPSLELEQAPLQITPRNGSKQEG